MKKIVQAALGAFAAMVKGLEDLLAAALAPLGAGIINEVGSAGPLHDGQVLHRGTDTPGGIYGVPAQGPVTQPTNPAQANASFSLGESAIVVYASTQSPAQVNANSTAEQALTVTGIRAGSVVHVIKPTTQAGLGICSTRVSAADTIQVTFTNVTAGNITPTATQQYRVIEFRGPLIQTATLSPAAVASLITAEQIFTLTPAATVQGLSSARVGLTSAVTALNQDPPARSTLAAGAVPGLVNQTPVMFGTPQTVVVNKPTAQAGLGIVNVRVAGNNQLGITFINTSGAPITPTAAQVYSFVAFRGVTLHSAVIHYIVDVGTLAQVNTVTAPQQTVTVHGLAVGDTIVAINKPTDQAGLGICEGRVTAANTLGIKFVNPTAGNITPTGDEHYDVLVMKDYIGMGAVLAQFNVVIAPVAVATITGAEQTFGVTGLVADAPVFVNVAVGAGFGATLGEPLPRGLAIGGARVSLADTLAINFLNVTAAAITPGSLMVTVMQAPLDRSGGVAGVDGSAVVYPIDNKATQMEEQLAAIRNALTAQAAIAGS